ncbi:MAG: hypothetical protein NTY19_43340 [Planctomycetota bacterium]|nr:hypothetical protein [Planctomycetota bacterium]
MNGFDDLVQSIGGLAAQMGDLHRRAVVEYTPVVEEIIRSNSRDVRRIEQALDGLLSFADDDPALQLYRRLCRHYWDIDPVATAEYVQAYRKMWDSDDETEPETQP